MIHEFQETMVTRPLSGIRLDPSRFPSERYLKAIRSDSPRMTSKIDKFVVITSLICIGFIVYFQSLRRYEGFYQKK